MPNPKKQNKILIFTVVLFINGDCCKVSKKEVSTAITALKQKTAGETYAVLILEPTCTDKNNFSTLTFCCSFEP